MNTSASIIPTSVDSAPPATSTSRAQSTVYPLERWAELITLFTILVFYTNAAVIAVQHHGLPVEIGGALLLLPALSAFYYVFVRREPIILNSVAFGALIWVIVNVVSLLRSDRPDEGFNTLSGILFEGFIPFLIYLNVLRSKEMLQKSIWVLLFAGSLLGGLSLYQQATGTFDKDYGGFAQMSDAAFRKDQSIDDAEDVSNLQPRLAGPIGEQNRYAQIMQMLIPLGILQIFASRTKKRKIAAAVATLLITVGMALTFSRGAAVSMGVLLVAMAAMGLLSWSRLIVLGLAGFGLLLAMPQYQTRMMSMLPIVQSVTHGGTNTSSSDGAIRSRLTEMSAGVHLFFDYPLTGAGPGVYRHKYREYGSISGVRMKAANRRAHCLYVEIAAELGVAGLICFAAIVLITLRNLWQVSQNCSTIDPAMSNIALALMLAMVSYLSTSVFLHASYIRYFWFLLALANAVTVIGFRTLRTTDEASSPTVSDSALAT